MKPMFIYDNRYVISPFCFNTKPPSNNNSCNTHHIKIVNRMYDSYDGFHTSGKVNTNSNVRNNNISRIRNTHGDPNKIYGCYDKTHKITASLINTNGSANPIHNNFHFNFNRICKSYGGMKITPVGQINDRDMNIKKILDCYDGTHKIVANTYSNTNPIHNNFYPMNSDSNANVNNNPNRTNTHMNVNKSHNIYDNTNNPTSASQINSVLTANKIFNCYDGTQRLSSALRYNNANPIHNNFKATFNTIYHNSNVNVNNSTNSACNRIKASMNANKTYNSYDAFNNPNSAGQINRLVLSNDKRLKLNRSSDRDFYSLPRFVTHVDDAFISSLTELYRERIPPGSEVLDLMSSWVSHLPPEIQYKRVVGHGLNPQELARNPRLDYFFVKDLNEEQTLEAKDCSFDAVLCTVSVQYLQQPEKVFAEIYRILRPGGLCIVSFSNRMFYEKAISAWREGTDYSRIQLVVQYFQCVTGFAQPEVVKKLPGSDTKSPFGWLLGLFRIMASDPFNAVIAYRNFKPI
ncbi:hypothetical protein KI387_028258 [Taxus chinensis]|uniref:Methyltransferase type 11 domain-containing protein n=1 Tax=Taxus chinensis TaxID=29808 RepID=A0AA38G199_TAXCH|nr:hypothetical protein KI387_028258 [Taxus chinensis]